MRREDLDFSPEQDGGLPAQAVALRTESHRLRGPVSRSEIAQSLWAPLLWAPSSCPGTGVFLDPGPGQDDLAAFALCAKEHVAFQPPDSR